MVLPVFSTFAAQRAAAATAATLEIPTRRFGAVIKKIGT